MATDLHRTAEAIVVIVALGSTPIAHTDLGFIPKPVQLEHAIDVVAADIVHPCQVGTDVVAFNRARSTVMQIQVRSAMTGHDPQQPLSIAYRQMRVCTQREALLGLAVARAVAVGYVVFVTVSPEPGTGFLRIEAQLPHSAAQRREFAIPHRRRGIEQRHDCAGGRADCAGRRIQEPIVAGVALLQAIGVCPQVDLATGIGKGERRVPASGMDHLDRLTTGRVDAATGNHELMIASRCSRDIEKIGLVSRKSVPMRNRPLPDKVPTFN